MNFEIFIMKNMDLNKQIINITSKVKIYNDKIVKKLLKISLCQLKHFNIVKFQYQNKYLAIFSLHIPVFHLITSLY